MGKLRVKVKLQGFELEVEGTREDASLISRSIGGQITGLFQSAGEIIDGEVVRSPPQQIESLRPTSNGTGKRSRRRRQAAPRSSEAGAAPTIEFKHSPDQFGNPRQSWKTSEKMIWLLYVLYESAGLGEVSNATLVSIFNKHFKQAGTVRNSNVSRDLGLAKTKEKPSLVGENASVSPSTWFLTDEGRKKAQKLVADSLGQADQLL